MSFLKETGVKLVIENYEEQLKIRRDQLQELEGVNSPEVELQRLKIAEEISHLEADLEEKRLDLEDHQKRAGIEKGQDISLSD